MITDFESSNMFNIISPHPRLHQIISFYNLVLPEAGTFSEKYTIIPNANETITISFDGKKIASDIWGISTHPQTIGTEPSASQILLLIELSPYGLYKITGIPQTEFSDKRLDLKSICPLLFSQLHSTFEVANSISELKFLLDEIFLSYLDSHELSGQLLLATQKIMVSGGTMSVRELAGFVNFSERHLNRIFHSQIGLNVKTFSRIIRFNHVLRYLQLDNHSFAELATQSGFFDQSHMVQDFKDICGVTPEAYIKNMSDFSYIEEQK